MIDRTQFEEREYWFPHSGEPGAARRSRRSEGSKLYAECVGARVNHALEDPMASPVESFHVGELMVPKRGPIEVEGAWTLSNRRVTQFIGMTDGTGRWLDVTACF